MVTKSLKTVDNHWNFYFPNLYNRFFFLVWVTKNFEIQDFHICTRVQMIQRIRKAQKATTYYVVPYMYTVYVLMFLRIFNNIPMCFGLETWNQYFKKSIYITVLKIKRSVKYCHLHFLWRWWTSVFTNFLISFQYNLMKLKKKK